MNTAPPLTVDGFLHPDLAALVETVRLGTVSSAAKALGISQPALSARLRRLSHASGGALFRRHGRLLQLTGLGSKVHDGALRVLRDCEALRASILGGSATISPLRIGTADAVPKIVVRRIIGPYLRAGMQLQCREWAAEHLERELVAHRLDMLVTDREPINLRSEDLETSLEGKSSIVLCAHPQVAKRLRPEFPRSLDEALLGLPAAPSPLRDRIDRWLGKHAPSAKVAVEAEDRSLLHHFAQVDRIVVPVAKSTMSVLNRQFGLVQVGDLTGVQESYFAVRSRWRVPKLG